MKKTIFGFVLGVLLTGSIAGVVAYNYNAKDVSYTPSDSNWNVNSVEDALKDLKTGNDRKYNERVAELEREYQTALSQVQGLAGNKLIFLTSNWKGAKDWNNYGLAGHDAIIDNNYLAYTDEGYIIKFKKDFKAKITIYMLNSETNSAAPQFRLVHNGSIILSGSNSTAASIHIIKTVNVNVKANDTMYLQEYGGGKAVFFMTFIEPIS